jgi:hypothetical protein
MLSWQSWGTDNQIIASVQTLINECHMEMGREGLPIWVEKGIKGKAMLKGNDDGGSPQKASKELALMSKRKSKRKSAQEAHQPTLLLISAGEEGGSHVRMLQAEFSSRLGCDVVSGTDSMSTWREQVHAAKPLTKPLTEPLTKPLAIIPDQNP